MTPHQTIAVAVRLFAIWLIISLVLSLLELVAQPSGQNIPNGFLVVIVAVATVTTLVTLALWKSPQTVARRLLATPAAESLPEGATSTPPDTWLAMGCSLIGLWVLASALPALIRDSVLLYFSDSTTDTSNVHNWLTHDFAQLLVAIWLTLGAKGFRQIFWWARHAGVNKAP